MTEKSLKSLREIITAECEKIFTELGLPKEANITELCLVESKESHAQTIREALIRFQSRKTLTPKTRARIIAKYEPQYPDGTMPGEVISHKTNSPQPQMS